jgi:hypothetical protein
MENRLNAYLLKLLMDNDREYQKAVDMIRKRQEYNRQYYERRKKQQTEPKHICGRKPIIEITQEKASETLQKYRLKCQKQNKKLNTPEEIKQEINKLFAKLKALTPDNK